MTEQSTLEPQPERLKRQFEQWVGEVNELIDEGGASAFVEARVNFDVEGRPGSQQEVKWMDEGGYREVMLQGVSRKEAEAVGHLTGAFVDTYFEKFQLPRQSEREGHPNTLYVSAFEINENWVNALSKASNAGRFIGELKRLQGKNVVELRYSQPKADESRSRPSEKRVLLVVPQQTSDELISMIEEGLDPNVVRDLTAEIFVGGENKPYFDASLIERSDRSITLIPDKSHLDSTHVFKYSYDFERNKLEARSREIAPKLLQVLEPELEQVEKLKDVDETVIPNDLKQKLMERIDEHLFVGVEPDWSEDAEPVEDDFEDMPEPDWSNGQGVVDPELEQLFTKMDAEQREARRERGKRSLPLSEEVRKGVSDALKETRLPAAQEYRQFLMDERWASVAPPDINPSTPPAFFLEMDETERRIHKIRLELTRAVNYKREHFSLKDIAENPDIRGISKTETQMLYESPGVRDALETWFDILNRPEKYAIQAPRLDENGRETIQAVTIFECGDRREIERYRNWIRSQVEGRLRNVADNKKAVFALSAEQISFNLLILGNAIETMDGRWRKFGDQVVRVRKPTCKNGDLLQIGLKNSMRPLDALIDLAGKDPSALVEVGALGEWAYLNITNGGRRRFENGFDQVVIVSEDEGGAWQNFWQVEEYQDQQRQRGLRLYVPECYPVEIIGNIFDETKIGGRTLSNYLAKRERIPWEKPEAQDLWGYYAYRLSLAVDYEGMVKGKDDYRLNMGEYGGSFKWKGKVEQTLGQFKLRDSVRRRRWIFYACTGLRRDTGRRPRISAFGDTKKIMRNSLGDQGLKYLRDTELFFPWDRPPIV